MKSSKRKRSSQVKKHVLQTTLNSSDNCNSSVQLNHQNPTCSRENNEHEKEADSSGKESELQTFHVKNIVCKCKMVREDNGKEDLFLELEFNPVEVSISGIPFKKAGDLSKIQPRTNEQWETDQLKRIYELRNSNEKWVKEFCPYCEPYVKEYSRFSTLKEHVQAEHPNMKDKIWNIRKNDSGKNGCTHPVSKRK